MKSDEQKIAEAVAALTARLTTWGVEEPHDKAHTYVSDMLRNGWRPRAAPVELPPMRPPERAADPARYIQAARAALRAHEPAARKPEIEESDQ